MQIPILNIYYLLCYAWDKLDEADIVNVNAIDTIELIDLFAEVLSNGLTRLLKQGLDRYYIEQDYEIIGVKGKINLSETVKKNILPLYKTVCKYDEFDYDILHNQILKTTIGKLLRVKKLDSSLKKKLHKLYIKLPPISTISIRSAHFNQVRLNRNNYYYDFILKICKILNENIFIDEFTGDYKFKDFLKEEKVMARLFESFIRNFYKQESKYKVTTDIIKWLLTSENPEDISVLPDMVTDIVLTSDKKKIIIDTKYYKEALKGRFEKKKIISGNLYQLFAYLKNQETDAEVTQNCEGILLYPSIDEDFEHKFKYKAHKIRIMSINLNQNWKKIKEDLLQIVA